MTLWLSDQNRSEKNDNLYIYFNFHPENPLYEDLTEESNLNVGKKIKMSLLHKSNKICKQCLVIMIGIEYYYCLHTSENKKGARNFWINIFKEKATVPDL